MSIRDAWLLRAGVEIKIQPGTHTTHQMFYDTRMRQNEQDTDHGYGANEVSMEAETPVQRPTLTSPGSPSVASPERFLTIPSIEKGTPENYVKPLSTLKEEI